MEVDKPSLSKKTYIFGEIYEQFRQGWQYYSSFEFLKQFANTKLTDSERIIPNYQYGAKSSKVQ